MSVSQLQTIIIYSLHGHINPAFKLTLTVVFGFVVLCILVIFRVQLMTMLICPAVLTGGVVGLPAEVSTSAIPVYKSGTQSQAVSPGLCSGELTPSLSHDFTWLCAQRSTNSPIKSTNTSLLTYSLTEFASMRWPIWLYIACLTQSLSSKGKCKRTWPWEYI